MLALRRSPVTDPATVMRLIHGDTVALDSLGKHLHEGVTKLVETEDKWEQKYDQFIEDLRDEYANSTSRLPGEDVRLSLARQAHRAEWQAYRTAKRNVEQLERRLSAKKAALSGRQSELSALRDEARAADLPQPQWTRSAA